MTINLVKAIQFLRPNEEWSLTGNEYSGLVWISNTPKPTEEELTQAWSAIENSVWWEPVRLERNSKLAASDWTQLSDVSISNKQAWAEYRQKLRDVTKDFQSPEDVIWPTEPS